MRFVLLLGLSLALGILFTACTPQAPNAPQKDALLPSAPTASPESYTLADVANHASRSSCWTAIKGDVYDLTPFIKAHPGGAANILQLCGKDGTMLFAEQHSGEEKPEARLESLKIGVLG